MLKSIKPLLFLCLLLPAPIEAVAADRAAVPDSANQQSAPQAAASSSQTDNGTVESFFQITKTQRNAQASSLPQPAVVPMAAPKKTPARGLSRSLWHVLDNMGVPMFSGFDPCIDPSIGGTYAIPAPKLPRERTLVRDQQKEVTAASTNTRLPDPTSATAPPQKLPASELDGVDLPSPQ